MGLGHFDKLTVQKSRPLFALWRSDLTLSEFKILDTYLHGFGKDHVVVFQHKGLHGLPLDGRLLDGGKVPDSAHGQVGEASTIWLYLKASATK